MPSLQTMLIASIYIFLAACSTVQTYEPIQYPNLVEENEAARVSSVMLSPVLNYA